MGKSKERGKKDHQRGKKESKSRAHTRPPYSKGSVSTATDSGAVEAVTAEKTTAHAEAPSLFSTKREQPDNSPNKRGAEEELNGEVKRAKVEGQ